MCRLELTWVRVSQIYYRTRMSPWCHMFCLHDASTHLKSTRTSARHASTVPPLVIPAVQASSGQLHLSWSGICCGIGWVRPCHGRLASFEGAFSNPVLTDGIREVSHVPNCCFSAVLSACCGVQESMVGKTLLVVQWSVQGDVCSATAHRTCWTFIGFRRVIQNLMPWPTCMVNVPNLVQNWWQLSLDTQGGVCHRQQRAKGINWFEKACDWFWIWLNSANLSLSEEEISNHFSWNLEFAALRGLFHHKWHPVLITVFAHRCNDDERSISCPRLAQYWWSYSPTITTPPPTTTTN